MRDPVRGEVWLVDLGMVAKVRPCLIMSVYAADTDRALTTVVPRTTSVRGSQFEVPLEAKFLRSGAFDAQNIITIPRVKFLRHLGTLTGEQLGLVETAVRNWLGLL